MAMPDTFNAGLEQIQAEIDRRIYTSRRETEALQAATHKELQDAKELFTRVGEEREKAIRQASDEREKAAGALRRELSQRTLEGDERLREHVQAQRDALEAALVSADLLERERIALIKVELKEHREASALAFANTIETRVRETMALRSLLEARIDAVASELTLQAAAQKEAITKAETASIDKFEAHNGLIEQMRQQAVKAEQTLAVVTATLLPRETFNVYRDQVEQRLNQSAGAKEGVQGVRTNTYQTNTVRVAIWSIIAALLVGTISIIVAIAVATHGFTK